jgi:hypothetical protein
MNPTSKSAQPCPLDEGERVNLRLVLDMGKFWDNCAQLGSEMSCETWVERSNEARANLRRPTKVPVPSGRVQRLSSEAAAGLATSQSQPAIKLSPPKGVMAPSQRTLVTANR